MEQRCIKNRRNSLQMEALVAYMEQHSLFARGQIMLLGPQGHQKYKSMWNELTISLNNLGPIKTVEGWQNSWKKLKGNCKIRKAKYMKAYNKTGHENNDIQINELDERINTIFGKHGVGLELRKELGFTIKRRSSSFNGRSDRANLHSLHLYINVLCAQYIKLKKLKNTIKKLIAQEFETFQI